MYTELELGPYGDYQKRTLRIKQFPTRHGLRVLSRLGGIAGPALAEGDNVAIALKLLFERLDEKTVDWLIDECSAYTEYSSAPGAWIPLTKVFDAVFGADYGSVLVWVRKCLEVNFVDFLATIGIRQRESQVQERSA